MLVGRGQLFASEGNVRPPPTQQPAPTHPLEAALVRDADRDIAVTRLRRGFHVRRWEDETEVALRQRGLLVGPLQLFFRFVLGLACATLLAWVATHKLELAALRERPNVGFLETLRLIAPVLCFVLVVKGRVTKSAEERLESLRELLATGRHPTLGVDPRSDTELTMLAVVFGISILSASHHAHERMLFPTPERSAGTSWTGGVRSCGSSCGGGGCGGGGCGGCGGCGSCGS